MRRKIYPWLLKNWGFAFFVLDVVLSFVMIVKNPITGHYINYTEPARALWRGEDPYGIAFPGSPGAFFYAPSCALFFYGFFALFPGRIGQFLYMALSFSVFWFGLKRLLRTLVEKKIFALGEIASAWRHLFWLMAGSETIGSIVAVKIDLLFVGLTFCFLNALLVNRKTMLLALLLGIATSWKVHPLLVFGLTMVAVLARDCKRAFRLGTAFAAGLGIGLLSPFAVLKVNFAVSVTEHWSRSLREFVAVGWLDNIFQHLFGFVARTFQVPINLSFANRVTALAGVLSAVFVFWSSRKLASKDLDIAYVSAVGLGSGFVVMFSHLIQSNSYIIYFPLVLALLTVASQEEWRVRPVTALLTICYLTISIVYSDLVPRSLYHTLYDCGVKPLGVLVLYIAVVYGLYQRARRQQRRTTPSH